VMGEWGERVNHRLGHGLSHFAQDEDGKEEMSEDELRGRIQDLSDRIEHFRGEPESDGLILSTRTTRQKYQDELQSRGGEEAI